jgi:hypothetical protein
MYCALLLGEAARPYAIAMLSTEAVVVTLFVQLQVEIETALPTNTLMLLSSTL